MTILSNIFPTGAFKSDKTKSTIQKDILTNEDISQIQQGLTEQQTTSGQTQTGQSSSASQGTSATDTTGSTTGTSTSNQQTTQTQQNLDAGTTQGLTNLIATMFGTAGKGAPGVAAGLDYAAKFDPQAFINQNMAYNDQQSQDALQQGVYGLTEKGGRGNTMTSIAANKAIQDAALARGKTLADTTAAANQIVGQNVQLAQGVNSSDSSNLANLIQVLKGATSQVTGTQATDSTQAQQTAQQANTLTTEAQQQATAQQTAAWQNLSEQIQQLLDSTKKTQTNETDIGKTSSSSLSFGLGSGPSK